MLFALPRKPQETQQNCNLDELLIWVGWNLEMILIFFILNVAEYCFHFLVIQFISQNGLSFNSWHQACGNSETLHALFSKNLHVKHGKFWFWEYSENMEKAFKFFSILIKPTIVPQLFIWACKIKQGYHKGRVWSSREQSSVKFAY